MYEIIFKTSKVLFYRKKIIKGVDNKRIYEKGELIRKHVTRKNKEKIYSEDKNVMKSFNPNIRSETDFDLIKGIIVTKYYDGDKAFATVTETLVGEDRAIVKREKEGDRFVIWDVF
jgi:hypothetical protein